VQAARQAIAGTEGAFQDRGNLSILRVGLSTTCTHPFWV